MWHIVQCGICAKAKKMRHRGKIKRWHLLAFLFAVCDLGKDVAANCQQLQSCCCFLVPTLMGTMKSWRERRPCGLGPLSNTKWCQQLEDKTRLLLSFSFCAMDERSGQVKIRGIRREWWQRHSAKRLCSAVRCGHGGSFERNVISAWFLLRVGWIKLRMRWWWCEVRECEDRRRRR